MNIVKVSKTLVHDGEFDKYTNVKDIIRVVYLKCLGNEKYRNELLETGESMLVYDSTHIHDSMLGCCYCERCKHKIAKNFVGIALMKVRAKLQGGQPIVSAMYNGNKFTYNFDYVFDYDAGTFLNETAMKMLSTIYRSYAEE
jgi:hypothetical protein